MNREQFIPLSIYQLDKRLIDKLIPFKPLDVAVLTRQAEMTASIFPECFRSSASACFARARVEFVTPITNRGGKSNLSVKIPSYEAKENLQIVSLGKQGRYQVIRIPKKDKGVSIKHSFIDWVNFTFKTANLPLALNTGHQAIIDYEYVQALSFHIFQIFGIGVTAQRPSGLNFYKNSFDIGDRGEGMVCIGGQRDSVLVTMKGQGLMASKAGWESRLKAFLETIPDAQITRLDLASDAFKSDVSIEGYLEMFRQGLFQGKGRKPNIECMGNWEEPNGKGRTIYIGGRTSGKLLRIYEKGKQIANGYDLKYPYWIRVELELKNIDRVIPFDALLTPGQYLAGAYPALATINKIQSTVKTYKNTAQATFTKAIDTLRIQYGKYIWVFNEILGSQAMIDVLTIDKQQIPKNLVFPSFQEYEETDFLHNEKVFTYLQNDINFFPQYEAA